MEKYLQVINPSYCLELIKKEEKYGLFKGRKCLRQKVLRFGGTAKFLRFCGKILSRLIVLNQFCGINFFAVGDI